MIAKLYPYSLCLGLLAGSLAIAPIAKAQIPITGGTASGDAAFFVPGAATVAPNRANTVLFDATVNTLTIQTPNGTTSSARFYPTAGGLDPIGRNFPQAGNTGTLQGTLSGVAFAPSTNQPVFFQGIPTTLAFTLNSFSPEILTGGTLISPRQVGTAPLLFAPVAPVTLTPASATNFQTDQGILAVGSYNAKLTGNSIQLPPDLKFVSTIDPILGPIQVPDLVRRVKFEFSGQNVTPTSNTNLSASSGTIRFAGPTNSFKIQSVGTPGQQEFKLEGTTGTLDISLQAPFVATLSGSPLTSTAATTYKIDGEARGITSLLNPNTVGFSGVPRKPTDFQFTQGANSLSGQSTGNVQFTVGVSGFNASAYDPTTAPTQNLGSSFGTSTTLLVPITFSIIPANFSLLFTGAARQQFLSRLTFTSTNVGQGNYILSPNDDARDDDDDDDNVSNYVPSFNSGATTYQLYAVSQFRVVVVRKGNKIVVLQRFQNRNVVRPLVVYVTVGLPGRVFPGMTGLREVQVQQTEIQLPGGTTSTGGTTTGSTTSTEGSTTTTTGSTTSTEGSSTTTGSTTSTEGSSTTTGSTTSTEGSSTTTTGSTTSTEGSSTTTGSTTSTEGSTTTTGSTTSTEGSSTPGTTTASEGDDDDNEGTIRIQTAEGLIELTRSEVERGTPVSPSPTATASSTPR